MFSGLKYLFSHYQKEQDIQRIVEMRIKRMEGMVNGDDWPTHSRRVYREICEDSARTEVDQRQMISMLSLIASGGFGLTGIVVAELLMRVA